MTQLYQKDSFKIGLLVVATLGIIYYIFMPATNSNQTPQPPTDTTRTQMQIKEAMKTAKSDKHRQELQKLLNVLQGKPENSPGNNKDNKPLKDTKKTKAAANTAGTIQKNDSMQKTANYQKCFNILERNYARLGSTSNGINYYFLVKNKVNENTHTLYEYNIDESKVRAKFSVQLGDKNTLNVSDKGVAVYTLEGASAACGTGNGTGILIPFNKAKGKQKLTGDFAVSPYIQAGHFAETAKKYLYYVDPDSQQKKVSKKIDIENSVILKLSYEDKKMTYLQLGESPRIIKENLLDQNREYFLKENESILATATNDDVYYVIEKDTHRNQFSIARLNNKLRKTKEISVKSPTKTKLDDTLIIAMPRFHNLILQGKNQFISQIWGGVYYINLHKKKYRFIKAPKNTIIGKVIPSLNQEFLILELLDYEYNFYGAGIFDLKKQKLISHAKL